MMSKDQIEEKLREAGAAAFWITWYCWMQGFGGTVMLAEEVAMRLKRCVTGHS